MPTYFALCSLISEAIRGDEQRLDQILQGAITPEQITLLDELFEKLPPDASHRIAARFALSGLYGLELRPRFVTIHTQQLFSLDAISTYKDLGYTITPAKRVDYEHLVSQWDDLLRLAVSIKLGYVKASTILKRLNSYARQHPLYKALKDLAGPPSRTTLQDGVHLALY